MSANRKCLSAAVIQVCNWLDPSVESPNMKATKYLFVTIFAVVLLAASAAAQNHSIHDVGSGDKFVSTDDGFEIALPADWVNETQLQTGRRYLWKFNEGSISVSIREFVESEELKTDADRTAFIEGYKGALQKDPGVKIISETPVKIGEYRGEAYNITLDGQKSLFIVLAWKKFNVVLNANSNGKFADSDGPLFDALKTFEFVHDDGK